MKPSDVEDAARPVLKSLAAFATKISDEQDLDNSLLAPIYDVLEKVEKVAAATKGVFKEKIKVLVSSSGRTFTDAGSKMMDLAGWRMEVRPSEGGTDYEELGRILKKRGVDRSDWMDKEVVWHPNKDKIQQLIGAGKITEKTLELCKKEGSYSIVAPHKIEEE